MTCELCEQDGGEVIHRGAQWRVVLVDDPDYPGFCRVIWDGHVQEMTDLPAPERAILMDAVWQVESALREVMRPDKVNLASLGNMVPHLHWHIIPRYAQDAHFPAPVWAEVKRVSATEELAERRALLPALRKAIAMRLGSTG